MALVTVEAYNSVVEANLAKNLLEAEGITAFLADEATATALQLTAPFAEVKLQVAEADVDKAMEVLKSAESHELAEGTEQEAEMQEEEEE